MRFDRWKDVVELTGIVAIVASLIFVDLQVQQDERTSRLELFDRAVDQSRELNGLISQHANVWYRGCSGVEMSGEDELVFVKIYNAYIDHNYLRWLRFTISDVTGGNGQFLIDAIAANIQGLGPQGKRELRGSRRVAVTKTEK